MTELLGRQIKTVHLEITNRCVLECSKCSRTGSDVIKQKGNLPVELIHRLFCGSSIERATICGNYGDAIYHPRFHDIISSIKSHNVRIDLTTNGSHRGKTWWAKTAELFSKKDRITFSIDGLEDTNHCYRKNSNWSDVMLAVRTMVPRTRVRWKFIVFRHNEHQIDKFQKLAAELGVHEVRINKSARFRLDKPDPLRPLDNQWIGIRSKNQTDIKRYLKGKDPSLQSKIKVVPQCKSSGEIFVDFTGRVYPCCSCAMYPTSEYASWFSHLRGRNSLHTYELDEILTLKDWSKLEDSWQSIEKCPSSCIKRCGQLPKAEPFLAEGESIAKPASDNIRINLS